MPQINEMIKLTINTQMIVFNAKSCNFMLHVPPKNKKNKRLRVFTLNLINMFNLINDGCCGCDYYYFVDHHCYACVVDYAADCVYFYYHVSYSDV